MDELVFYVIDLSPKMGSLLPGVHHKKPGHWVALWFLTRFLWRSIAFFKNFAYWADLYMQLVADK